MANTYTWYTDMNIPIADSSTTQAINSSLLWGFKAVLKGEVTGSNGINGAAPSSSYWTTVSSSDGSNVAASDLWGSTYDSSKFTYGDNLTNYTGSHSWMVLRSPSSLTDNGYLYLLLLYSGPSSAQYVGAFISNTVFTGGTASRRPASTNEVSLYNVSTTSNMQLGLGSSTTGDYKYHLCRTSNGMFWFAASKNGSGEFGRLIGIGKTSETRSPEGQAWYTWWEHISNNYTQDYIGDPSYWGSYGGFSSRTHNDLYDTELSPIIPYVNATVSGQNSFMRTTTNVQGDLDAFPLYMYYKGTSQIVQYTSVGIKGKIEDAFISSYLPGSVYPTSGDVERVAVGALWLPFDVAPQL
jgi:hypothetical protein